MFLTDKRIFRLAMVLLVVMGVTFVSGAVLADDKDRGHGGYLPAGVEMVNTVILKKVITYREKNKKVYEENLDDGEIIDKKVGIIQVEIKQDEWKKDKIYRFNGSVEVFNGRKERISMDELPVPCRAKLYYYPNERNARYLYRIEVLGNHKGVSQRWDEEFRDL